MRFVVIVLVSIGVAACTPDESDATPPIAPSPTEDGISAAETNRVEANGVVTYVVDGDTIEVDFDGATERVRLIGIDTPEKAIAERNQAAECYGPEATEYTRTLLSEGTEVRVERDTVPRDDYGRLLGYVYRAHDGLFVNDDIVRQGYARPLTIAPNDTFADRFVEAARAAERADIGLWAACADGGG